MAPLPLPLTRDQSAVRRAAPRWADFNTLPAPLRLGPVTLTPRSRALMDSLRLDDLEDDTTADTALPSPASIAALVGPERLMEPLHGSRRPLILPPLITFAPPPAFASSHLALLPPEPLRAHHSFQERLAKLDVIIAGDDVSKKKPDPEIYNTAVGWGRVGWSRGWG